MDSFGDQAAKTMAGEITLSDDCCKSIKRYRQMFGVRSTELAKRLSVSPSVISDYESGRRNSPGTAFVSKFVKTLVAMDAEKGGHIISQFSVNESPEAILAMSELSAPCDTDSFLKIIKGTVIANEELLQSRTIRGYTVIDSIQAILTFGAKDFKSIYGSSTERALIFTKVKMGRSPMIAIKVTQPKPSVMVLHGLRPKQVDDLAIHLAQKERIPLVVSCIKDERSLIENLRRELN